MKVPYSWLQDHLDTRHSAAQIADRLSIIGLEVESVDNKATGLEAFTLARVVATRQHPNADKLRVADVEIAKDQPTVEVVCGAPNCRPGMITVFAALGTTIPDSGLKLERKPVRGIVSNGMLCSERELKLSEEHTGIIDLDPGLADRVGSRMVDVLGLDDPVLDIKITPNRPDCTGVRGIARDIAAAGLGRLKPEPKLRKVEGRSACPVEIRLEFENGDTSPCPVFAGRHVAGVTNGPSPAWLQARLRAAGLRPISALVDITNYISLDRGRPLHVYDADKIAGAIRARLARSGESVLALDKRTYDLDSAMCVIADDSGVLGLGGVIGGESTSCSATTRNVLIECAYFDPVRIAATGRRAGVQTDARYRFERGVDPGYVAGGLDLATHWVLELCGGTPSKRAVAGEAPVRSRIIDFDMRRIGRLAGIDVPSEEAARILTALGFGVETGAAATRVTVPTWRPDVHGPADLVEEVARIVGLDTVPPVALPAVSRPVGGVLTERQRRMRRARRLLATRGMVETVTWSFIRHDDAVLFGGGQPEIELQNPISSDMSAMRPSLLPGLLRAAQRNRDRGFTDVALFEIGQAYGGDRDGDQRMVAAGVRLGAVGIAGSGRHWSGHQSAAAALDAKADVIAVLAALGIDGAKAQVTRDAGAVYHPGRSGVLRLGPKVVLARFGELHPKVQAALELSSPAVAFEIHLDALPGEKRKATRARPPFVRSDLQPVRRDFAFEVEAQMPAGEVIKAVEKVDKSLITAVSVFDVYADPKLGAGTKSIAIEVELQPRDRTLTETDIDTIGRRIVAEVEKATGGRLRSG